MTGGRKWKRNGVHIPDDIITCILTRLPCTSLLRFKAACKIWYSLISNPEFINLHYKQSCQNPKIILLDTEKGFELLDCDRLSFDKPSALKPLEFPGFTSAAPGFIGSCRGLVCVATDHGFYIWNPVTRSYKTVPNLSPTIAGSWGCFRGLGYDPVSDDFKLILLSKSGFFLVSSLKANSQKRIFCPFQFSVFFTCDQYPVYDSTLATVVNGVFYWLAKGPIIVALDSSKEKFEMVQLPAVVDGEGSFENLLEYQECLCVSYSKYLLFSVKELWMMKEHGWIHLLTVKGRDWINAMHLWYSFYKPMFICESSGEVVLLSRKHLVRSTKEENRFGRIFIQHPICETIIYVETLISPDHIIRY